MRRDTDQICILIDAKCKCMFSQISLQVVMLDKPYIVFKNYPPEIIQV